MGLCLRIMCTYYYWYLLINYIIRYIGHIPRHIPLTDQKFNYRSFKESSSAYLTSKYTFPFLWNPPQRNIIYVSFFYSPLSICHRGSPEPILLLCTKLMFPCSQYLQTHQSLVAANKADAIQTREHAEILTELELTPPFNKTPDGALSLTPLFWVPF